MADFSYAEQVGFLLSELNAEPGLTEAHMREIIEAERHAIGSTVAVKIAELLSGRDQVELITLEALFAPDYRRIELAENVRNILEARLVEAYGESRNDFLLAASTSGYSDSAALRLLEGTDITVQQLLIVIYNRRTSDRVRDLLIERAAHLDGSKENLGIIIGYFVRLFPCLEKIVDKYLDFDLTPEELEEIAGRYPDHAGAQLKYWAMMQDQGVGGSHWNFLKRVGYRRALATLDEAEVSMDKLRSEGRVDGLPSPIKEVGMGPWDASLMLHHPPTSKRAADLLLGEKDPRIQLKIAENFSEYEEGAWANFVALGPDQHLIMDALRSSNQSIQARAILAYGANSDIRAHDIQWIFEKLPNCAEALWQQIDPNRFSVQKLVEIAQSAPMLEGLILDALKSRGVLSKDELKDGLWYADNPTLIHSYLLELYLAGSPRIYVLKEVFNRQNELQQVVEDYLRSEASDLDDIIDHCSSNFSGGETPFLDLCWSVIAFRANRQQLFRVLKTKSAPKKHIMPCWDAFAAWNPTEAELRPLAEGDSSTASVEALKMLYAQGKIDREKSLKLAVCTRDERFRQLAWAHLDKESLNAEEFFSIALADSPLGLITAESVALKAFEFLESAQLLTHEMAHHLLEKNAFYESTYSAQRTIAVRALKYLVQNRAETRLILDAFQGLPNQSRSLFDYTSYQRRSTEDDQQHALDLLAALSDLEPDAQETDQVEDLRSRIREWAFLGGRRINETVRRLITHIQERNS